MVWIMNAEKHLRKVYRELGLEVKKGCLVFKEIFKRLYEFQTDKNCHNKEWRRLLAVKIICEVLLEELQRVKECVRKGIVQNPSYDYSGYADIYPDLFNEKT